KRVRNQATGRAHTPITVQESVALGQIGKARNLERHAGRGGADADGAAELADKQRRLSRSVGEVTNDVKSVGLEAGAIAFLVDEVPAVLIVEVAELDPVGKLIAADRFHADEGVTCGGSAADLQHLRWRGCSDAHLAAALNGHHFRTSHTVEKGKAIDRLID